MNVLGFIFLGKLGSIPKVFLRGRLGCGVNLTRLRGTMWRKGWDMLSRWGCGCLRLSRIWDYVCVKNVIYLHIYYIYLLGPNDSKWPPWAILRKLIKHMRILELLGSFDRMCLLKNGKVFRFSSKIRFRVLKQVDTKRPLIFPKFKDNVYKKLMISHLWLRSRRF